MSTWTHWHRTWCHRKGTLGLCRHRNALFPGQCILPMFPFSHIWIRVPPSHGHPDRCRWLQQWINTANPWSNISSQLSMWSWSYDWLSCLSQASPQGQPIWYLHTLTPGRVPCLPTVLLYRRYRSRCTQRSHAGSLLKVTHRVSVDAFWKSVDCLSQKLSTD